MAFLSVQRKIMAPLEKVWAAASDFTRPPAPSWQVAIIKNGDHKNFGIGCERLVKHGKSVYHERLESADPYNAYTYSMLFGAPFKKYLAKVEFSAEKNTTLIQWSLEYIPKIPLTGWIAKAITKKNINIFLDDLEKICSVMDV